MIFEKTKISVYINYPFKYVNVISDLIRQYLLYRLRTTRAIFVIDFIKTSTKKIILKEANMVYSILTKCITFLSYNS